MNVKHRSSLLALSLILAGASLVRCGEPEPLATDGGTGGDAGVQDDAGLPEDGGTEADAGVPEDAGLPEDGGTEADGGTGDDAGTPEDGGTQDDGGTSEDAGTPDGGSVSGDLVTVTVPVGGPDDVVASYLMDAPSGSWNIFSGEFVPLGRREDPVTDTGVSYHTALRFPDVPVPQGAEIREAVVSWFPTNEVDSSNILLLNVWAHAADDSAAFDPSNYESGRPDQRLRTTAYIDKMVIRCNTDCAVTGPGPDDCECLPVWDYGCRQRVQDCWDRTVRYDFPKPLAPLAQEVVDRAGWQAGGALTFLFVNAAGDSEEFDKYRDSRTLTGWVEGETDRAPTLTITYVAP